MKLEHVLVVRPGALGDAVLTLPVLEALRRAGTKRFTILGTPANWGFLPRPFQGVDVQDFGGATWLGLFAALLDDSRGSGARISELARGVTLSPAAQAVLRTTDLALVYCSGIESERFTQFGTGNVVLAEPPLSQDQTGQHAARRLLAGLQGIVDSGTLERAFQSLDAEYWLRPGQPSQPDFGGAIGDEDFLPAKAYYVIHPGSGGQRKCWALEKYVLLARRLAEQAPVCILIGYADEDLRREFESALPAGERTLYVQRGVRDVLALLARARGYAGNDSGISHLAGRVCATTVLFGPTHPEVWRPLGPDVRVLRAADGRLESIAVEEVLESVLR